MLGPFVGAVHRHLKSWSLGAVLQCLERFLEEPAFRNTLIQKPSVDLVASMCTYLGSATSSSFRFKIRPGN